MDNGVKFTVDADVSGLNRAGETVDKVAGKVERLQAAMKTVLGSDIKVKGLDGLTQDFGKATDKAGEFKEALDDIADVRPGSGISSLEAQIKRLATQIEKSHQSAERSDRSRTMADVRRSSVMRRTGGVVGGFAAGMVTGGSGGIFGAAGSAVGAAAGLIPEVGAFVGPMLGALFGGIGSKVDQGISEFLTQGLELSRLRRSLGEASGSFDEFNSRLKGTSYTLGISGVDAAKLAAGYAHNSGLTDQHDIFRETQTSSMFAQGFGLQPSSGANFFSSMQRMGQFNDDAGARKMGLAVAEAIGQGNMFSKADEVLQAIANYTQVATQSSLSAADSTRYMASLAAGVSLHQPGLDVQGTANLLNQADQAVRNGGAMGLPSRIAEMTALNNGGPGASVFDINTLMAGGFFGSRRSMFGAGSMASRWAQGSGNKDLAKHYAALASGAGANATNGDQILKYFRQQSASPDTYLSTLGNAFGIGREGAMALDMISRTRGGLGGMSAHLSKLGVDPSTIKPGQFSAVAQIFSGDAKTLSSFKEKLLNGEDGVRRASGDEAAAINKASGEGLRDLLLKAFAGRDRGLDKAEEANKAQVSLHEAFVQFSGVMLPVTTKIQEGIYALVQKMAPDTVLGKELGEDQKAHDEAVKKAQNYAANVENDKKFADETTWVQADKNKKELAYWSMRAKVTPEQMQALRDADKEIGLPQGRTFGTVMTESRFDGNAESSKQAQGYFQITPIAWKEAEKTLGHIDHSTFENQLRAYTVIMKENMKTFHGDIDKATQAYSAGPSPANWNNRETQGERVKVPSWAALEADAFELVKQKAAHSAPAQSTHHTVSADPLKLHITLVPGQANYLQSVVELKTSGPKPAGTGH